MLAPGYRPCGAGRVQRSSASAAVGGLGRVLDAQQRDGRLEVLQRVEALVDAGEAQVGDLVELPQRRQDRQADVVRVDLGDAGRADGLLDALGEQGEVGVVHRAALARLAHAGHDLLAAERLDDAVALDDAQARGLGRAEAAAALGALPAAADREPVVARARVDDATVGVAAERAEHGRPRIRAACRQRDWPVEAGVDRVAVGGQLLGVAQGPDAVAHRLEARAVVADDLLRSQEGRRAQPGREPRLSAGGQHVIRAREVVAEAHRGVGAEEDRAGVLDEVERRSGLGGVQLEVLGPVRVAERGGGRDVVDQHDRRLAAVEGLAHAIGVPCAGRKRIEGGDDGLGELRRVGDEHGGRQLVVLGLAHQVGGDQARVGGLRRR